MDGWDTPGDPLADIMTQRDAMLRQTGVAPERTVYLPAWAAGVLDVEPGTMTEEEYYAALKRHCDKHGLNYADVLGWM